MQVHTDCNWDWNHTNVCTPTCKHTVSHAYALRSSPPTYCGRFTATGWIGRGVASCAHARPTSNQDVTTKSRMPAEPQIQFLTNLRTFVNKIQSVMNSSAQASRWYPATSASDLIFVSTHSVTSLRAYIKVITGDVQAMATTSNQQQRRGKPLPVAFQAMRPHRKAAHHRKYAKHSASVP